MVRDTYADLHEAGRHLAGELARWAGRTDTVVLAVPRAGVPIGYEVAVALGAPLDVHLVHELVHPRAGDAVLGAVASGGARAVNSEVVRVLGFPAAELARLIASETDELARLERAYRGDLPPLDLAGRTVILVDRGLARGWAMMAAVAAIQRRHPAHVVLAAPVGKHEVCEELRLFADQVVVARRPEPFYKVRTWYDDEREPGDDEIRELVHLRAPQRRPSMAPWATQVVRWAA